MSVSELWIVRHGQTVANAARTIQGQSESRLSDEGEAQARALGRWLASSGPRFDAAVSSPLGRARRTAELAIAQLDVALHEEPRFMERAFGQWEGQPADEVWAQQDALGDDPYTVRPEGGESTHDMATRVRAALLEWAARDDVGERLLVVSHGGPIGAIIAHALDIPYTRDHMRRVKRDNTGITVLKRKPVGLVVEMMNARPHL